MEYIVFTDESSITGHRFPSLSAFSMPFKHYEEMRTAVSNIIHESNTSEFKWEKLKNAKYYFCAEKLINLLFQNLFKYDLRIDAIVWDTRDSRHKIRGRDDIANYERMFFHLLKNSMMKRPKGSVWHIRPDVRGGIDWATIRECLYHIGKRREYQNTIFDSFISDPFFIIKSFMEKHSHEEILIQIADLFSGLSSFSRDKYDKYQIWQNRNQISFDFFGEKKSNQQLSNSENFRCKLLNLFNKKCKKFKLGVSLNSTGCLRTFDLQSPINFWFYESQGEYDKAPTRY